MTIKSNESNLMDTGKNNGDYSGSSLCGAKAKTNGHQPCRLPAMENGRCRFHGGLTPKHNTGPKTPEGRQRQRTANWKHGRYSQEFLKEEREVREFIRQCKKEPETFNFF